MPLPNLNSPVDPEVQAVAHTIVQELNSSYGLYNWPLYYKRILLCHDLNVYGNRYKFVILLLINKLSEFWIDEIIKFINPYYVSPGSVRKIHEAYKFYARRLDQDLLFRRSVYSFNGRFNYCTNFLGDRITGVQHKPDEEELNGMSYDCLMRLRNLDLIEALNVPYVRFSD